MPVRYGRQTPTFETTVEYDYSFGVEAVDMFEGFGLRFYESQKYEMRIFLARKEDGSFACRTICISKPRQNGKSYAARAYAVWMAAVEGRNVLYSAHHGKTTADMFKAIRDLCKMDEELHEMLGENEKGIIRSFGREEIIFYQDGSEYGRIVFQTRTSSSGRGGTYDIIIIDEAQELTDSEMDAIKPTTIASDSGDPQIIYLGTPPNEKCPGTVFRGLHAKAHKDPEGCGIVWMEWAATSVPNMEDAEAVLEIAYETNPALGYRIREDVMLDAIKTATNPEGFAREYLGWWCAMFATLAALNAQAWNDCKTDNPPEDGITVFAAKFSTDGRAVSVAAAIRTERGAYVELIFNEQTGSGINWLAEWLAERKGKAAQIVIDGKSGSAALVTRLEELGVPKVAIIEPSSTDVARSCSLLENATNERTLTHMGQKVLDATMTRATRRKIGTGGGWGFDGTGDVDPSIAEACALAYWQAVTTKRNPNRKVQFA